MNIILIIAAVIAVITVFVVVYGYTKPRHSFMKRTIDINASANIVYEFADDLHKFVEFWSPWTEKDPELTSNFNDILTGVGAVYEWKGHPRKVGSGLMKITDVEENKKVESLLKYTGRGDAFVTLSIEEINENQVQVTWSYTSDAGNNPVGRLIGSMMDKFLGPDFELGLNKLKAISEKQNN